MEKPAEFAGKRVDEVTPAQLEALIKGRRERQLKTAQTIGGSAENDTGAGPPHWYENYNATNSRAWMISDPEDGKIPATTDEAKKRAAAVRAACRGGDGYNTGPFDGPQDLTLYVRCITRGLPGSMMPAIYGNTYDITQGPGFVAIRYEMVHETRVIPLDGRPHLPASLQSYMGDARGRWEGDTLVVESFGFHPGTWLDRDGNTHTDKLRLTERYRRPNFGSLEVEVTFSDPQTYTRPWTVKVGAQFAADTEMLEWVCNEGAGRSLAHWVGSAADDRKNEVHLAPELLSRYVGTYVEQPPFWRGVQIIGQAVPSGRTVVMTVANGKLVGNMDGRGQQVLIATSETEFAGLYGLGVEFIDGGAGGLYVKHVSGNYRFARK
jgi:hypothetical protein